VFIGNVVENIKELANDLWRMFYPVPTGNAVVGASIFLGASCPSQTPQTSPPPHPDLAATPTASLDFNGLKYVFLLSLFSQFFVESSQPGPIGTLFPKPIKYRQSGVVVIISSL
jgi:hypothetical protein